MSSLDDLSRSIIPQLFLILIFTLINGFFASAEMAFISVNKHKINSLCQEKNKKAILLIKLLEDPSSFLSTIQIGITLASVKSIYVISKISKPFIKILSLSTKIVLKFTLNDDVQYEDKITTEEIKLLIKQSEKNGTINCMKKEMIDKVFDFSDKMSKEIMTSRTDTALIDIDDDINTKLNAILGCKYSRIPVYQDSVDNIIGILYIKDLIRHLVKCNFDNLDLKSLLHSPCFAPETKKIDELFLLLKQSKNHMAILIDEYGGFSGIVTLEDIIEEIVGDIEDEYDIDNNKVINLGHGNFEVKGNMSIIDFNNTFNTTIKCENYDTINGYIISTINKIPCNEENIILNIENYEIQVIEVDDNRIEKVKVNFARESVS